MKVLSVSITRQACPSSGWFLVQARVHAFQPECRLLFGEDPIGKRTWRSWRLRSSIPFERWRRPWISQTLNFIGLCPGRIRVRDVWVCKGCHADLRADGENSSSFACWPAGNHFEDLRKLRGI